MNPITAQSGHVFATVSDTTVELDIYRAGSRRTFGQLRARRRLAQRRQTDETAERIAPLARYGVTAWFPPPPLPTSSTTSRAPSVPTRSRVLHTVKTNSGARMTPHSDQRPPRARLHRRSTACVPHVYDRQSRSRLVQFDRHGLSWPTGAAACVAIRGSAYEEHLPRVSPTIPERTAHNNDRRRFSPIFGRYTRERAVAINCIAQDWQ